MTRSLTSVLVVAVALVASPTRFAHAEASISEAKALEIARNLAYGDSVEPPIKCRMLASDFYNPRPSKAYSIECGPYGPGIRGRAQIIHVDKRTGTAKVVASR